LADKAGDSEALEQQAETWLALVNRQQEVADRLQELIDEQRRLAVQWHDAGAMAVAAHASSVESALRDAVSRLLKLELLAVDSISGKITEAAVHLRTK
jgi:hypothetical protein